MKLNLTFLRIIVIFSSFIFAWSFSNIYRLLTQLRFPISGVQEEIIFQDHSIPQLQTILSYRHRHKDFDSSKSSIGWYIQLKRFLPDLYQSWIRKGRSVLHPKGGIEQKYHVQLLVNRFDEKFEVKRNLRIALPDISAVTAEHMTDQAFANGRVVVRVFESLVRTFT